MFLLGLIHAGPDAGFGVYGLLSHPLSHLTQHHLEQLPATVKQEFPRAQSIAMAGRLPGLITAAGECEVHRGCRAEPVPVEGFHILSLGAIVKQK